MTPAPVLPVGSLSRRPVVRRYGVLWVDWDETDFCEWFAVERDWLPSDTVRQPVGMLDRLVDTSKRVAAERDAEAERAKNRRPF